MVFNNLGESSYSLSDFLWLDIAKGHSEVLSWRWAGKKTVSRWKPNACFLAPFHNLF